MSSCNVFVLCGLAFDWAHTVKPSTVYINIFTSRGTQPSDSILKFGQKHGCQNGRRIVIQVIDQSKIKVLYKSVLQEKTAKFGVICENCLFGLNWYGNTLNLGSRMMFCFRQL